MNTIKNTFRVLGLLGAAVIAGICIGDMTGCISGQASDTVAATETYTFPVPVVSNLPSFLTCAGNGPVFMTSDTTSFDISDTFTQLKKQASISVNFDTNSLMGNLSSFKHADLYIYANGDTNPTAASNLLAQTNFDVASTSDAGEETVNLALSMSQTDLFNLLASGPVNVLVELSTCVPSSTTGSFSVQYTLAAIVSLSVNKSL